jgi:hypothetical protein
MESMGPVEDFVMGIKAVVEHGSIRPWSHCRPIGSRARRFELR